MCCTIAKQTDAAPAPRIVVPAFPANHRLGCSAAQTRIGSLRSRSGCEGNDKAIPIHKGDLPMSHAQSAETFARQVAAKRTPEEKLDTIARSLVEMAQAIKELDLKISRLPSE